MNEDLERFTTEEPEAADEIKTCCAAVYQSDLARFLLGESFHPGSEVLMLRVGKLLQLGPESRVLDVASGQGTSACLLAQHFGCQVVGIDYGADAVQRVNEHAQSLGLAQLVSF